MTIVLEARDVAKTLGEGPGQVLALRGVSLALRAGELTLLMGPSGSGKTTLLSIMGCVMTPSAGEIRIGGEPVGTLKPEQLARVRRDNIGFVFQSYHLFPTLTAAENVAIVLDLKGQLDDAARTRVNDALSAVGIAHKASSFPSRLSGGEQQRVAIARAIVAAPPVVLADEPTAALDGVNGQAVMEVLARIAKERKRAVLAVTHDPRTIPFADRIVKIEDGLIVGEERPTGPLAKKWREAKRRQEVTPL
jgi:putative ABC transport system ATP-binding protein